MTQKLPVLATLAEAVRLVVDKRGDLLRVGLVLTLGIFAIGVLAINYVLPMLRVVTPAGSAQPVMDPRFMPAMLVILAIEFLLIAVFAVGWHRLILLGRQRAGGGLGTGLGARELRYFGRIWLCFFGLIVIGVVFSSVELVIARLMGASPYSFLAAAYVGYLLVAGFVIGRLGLTFAALSIDLPFSFAQSWRATAGNGMQLLAVYLLIWVGWLIAALLFGALANALGLGEAAPYALMFINAVMTCVLMAMLVTVNTLAFRRLSGWTPPP
jgi:hypothetical protein